MKNNISNMGMRQIESMNNILNIVGKYNDYVIPVGPSGEPPVQFDIMQGQDINTPTDMMDKMEEAAVNTVMPYEMVNGTYQQDFAVHYSMSNTRFLRAIMTRQRKVESFYSKIYTKLYNFEFGENYPMIEIMLPPPLFLIMQNNSQLFDNIDQMAEKIANLEIVGNEEDDDKLKQEFKRQYIRTNLSTYIDWGLVDRLIESGKVTIEANKKPATEDGDESSPEAMLNDEL